MNCNECFEAFSSALDGELAPSEQNAMTDHLESCQDCRALQTKMLALSAELKAQPFPEVPEARVKQLAAQALEGAQASRLGWLRRLIRLPYENWALRASFRTLSFSTLAVMVFLSGLVRHLLPSYSGGEAVSKTGLPNASQWWSYAPSQTTLVLVAVLTLLVGLWVAGLPGFLLDLWTGSKLTQKDILRLGLGSLCLGPVITLPLLAGLALPQYVLLCSAWAAACLILTYLVVAFQTPRPLPRLAVDFVILTIVVGLLEWLARAAQSFPSPQELGVLVSLLVGSVPFQVLALSTACLLLSFIAFTLGLTTAIPSYRAGGGRLLAVLFFLSSAALGVYSFQTFNPLSVAEPVKARFVGERRAFLLGSSKDNTWILSSLAYPALEVNVVGSEVAPRAARLRLLAAYLDWDESAVLESLVKWAEGAPGVTWGLASFVDELGQRRQNVLSVPTKARIQAVESLLANLRWRILDRVQLSNQKSSVKGTVMGLRGQPLEAPLRLLKLKDGETLNQATRRLAEEHDRSQVLLDSDQLQPNLGLPGQRVAVPNQEGEYEFARLEPGRYVLCVLLTEPQTLTLNPTIPGIFQLDDEQSLELPEIRLTAGEEGQELSLAVERWEAGGPVTFSENSEVTTARLEPGASITGFVETEIFAGGKGRLKVLTVAEPETEAELRALYYAKSGRMLKDWTLDLSGSSGPRELPIDSGKEPGYLQLIVSSRKGQITVKSLKWESSN